MDEDLCSPSHVVLWSMWWWAWGAGEPISYWSDQCGRRVLGCTLLFVFLTLWPWASQFTLLSFSTFICKLSLRMLAPYVRQRVVGCAASEEGLRSPKMGGSRQENTEEKRWKPAGRGGQSLPVRGQGASPFWWLWRWLCRQTTCTWVLISLCVTLLCFRFVLWK